MSIKHALPESPMPVLAEMETTKNTDTGSNPPVFPIVGLGASAGGLSAFEAFFSAMPAGVDPGMAFVLVQHLAPDHKSMLSELIRRYTRMSVFEVEDGMVVQPNCAYIIPPGYDMAFLNGALQLLEPVAPRGRRLPIDFFFRSLAQDQHERAIGVVLSGTGSDGTLGVRAIKGEGGMVMAQNPGSTEFDGMPRSAIATGLVDYELPPAEMPAQIIAYAAHAFGKLPRSAASLPTTVEGALKKIFVLLRSHTGHDFSKYKPNTISRRIERRMAVHQTDGVDNYVKFLQHSPAEVEALFRDLLIGVTSFFRDPEAFRMMENVVVPALFADQSPGSAIRIWTPGCSTGEEAYSIAILLVERMEALKVSFTVQIFSSDIDKRAIAIARAGVYPASIAADVSPERLARFFKLEEGGDTYRIHKSLRDLLIFSEQSVIKDPPFSKLDLICCRNLLIYLGSALQKQVIPLFHYALNPGGWLFLGTSEGVGDFGRLFGVLDRKAKVFRRSETQSGRHRPTSQGSGQFSTGVDVSMATARVRTKKGVTGRTSLRETTEQALLSHMIAAGALVTSRGDILYLHGRSGMFLEPSPGESGVNNIVKMARDGLRRELTSALHKAVSRGETVTSVGLRVRTNGHFSTVNLTVSPVIAGSRASADSPLYLVVLEESSFPYSPKVGLADDYASFGDDGLVPPDAVALIAALRLEMVSREEYIQTVSEELESSSEELKSSNEEMQSVNEELQSTNEELETSKEELQSVNEELATVNQELQEKVTDLSRANNDMNNLLAGTGIGTVFVDFQLRILRFTPAVSSIINLIASDVGRPVAHIVSNLVGYTSLVADVKAVLATLVPNEVRVHTVDGRTYTMHIRAYRTLDNVIEGAVISFLDVTDVAMEQVVLARTTARLRRTGAIAKIGGWELTLDNMQLTCSPESLLINDVSTPDGLSVDQAMAMVDPEYRAVQQVALEAAIEHGTPWDLEQRLTTAKGRRIWTRTQGIAEMVDGKVVRLHGSFHDITEQKQIEQTLRQANDLLRVALAVGDSRYAIIAHDLKGQTLAWNPGAVRMYGWTEAEALKINVRERLPELLRARLIDSPSAAHYLESNRTQRLTKDGKIVEVSTIATALLDPAGKVYAIATTERPIADDQS